MHRAVAAWLTERPWRAVLVAGLCGIMLLQMLLPLTVLAGAIPVLAIMRLGPRTGLAAAAAGALPALWIVLALAGPSIGPVLGIGTLFFGPLLLGVLLRRTGSLNLCFQVAALASALAVGLVYAVLADPAAVWVEPLRTMLESMETAGLSLVGDGQDAEALIAAWASSMWGALAAVMLAIVLGALFLGRWWASLVEAPGHFGAEYRALRLGRVLGFAVTILFVAALFADSTLIASLAWVAFVALAFQGLAAAHRGKAGGRLSRGWLAVIYVLLIVPLSTSITVFALAIWGFVDNWFATPAGRIAHKS